MITEEDIKNALNNDEIYLVYQPIVDLKTHKIVAYEALGRWKDISPEILFALVEGYQIHEVTQVLLDKASKAFTLLNKPIHFNITYSDIGCLKMLSNVSIELAENILYDNKIEAVKKICEEGSVWIDDLFSDYSGLKWIPQLNLKGVKLDKFLVDQIETDRCEDYISFLEGIRKMLQLPVICEGIETQKQAYLLKELGFEYGQGFYFYKPQTLENWVS